MIGVNQILYKPALGWRKRKGINMEKNKPVGEVSKAEFGDYLVIRWQKGYVARLGDKFYTASPKQWAGLTSEEIDLLLLHYEMMNQWPKQKQIHAFTRAIEDRLKEKNFL